MSLLFFLLSVVVFSNFFSFCYVLFCFVGIIPNWSSFQIGGKHLSFVQMSFSLFITTNENSEFYAIYVLIHPYVWNIFRNYTGYFIRKVWFGLVWFGLVWLGFWLIDIPNIYAIQPKCFKPNLVCLLFKIIVFCRSTLNHYFHLDIKLMNKMN